MSDDRPRVCSVCRDTHKMTLHYDNGDEQVVSCTHCPTPCQQCRFGGNGAYCATTPCSCKCHKPVMERYRPLPDDVRLRLIAFARDAFRGDGPRAVAAHKLCDELEHYAGIKRS